MSQILLLVEQKENRRLLLEWLAVYYEVLLPNSTENSEDFLPFNQSFDLAIIDGLALKRHWQWVAAQKEAEHPVCLPFLLITSRSDVGMATQFIWQSIDDLIIAPIEKIELQARVEILLRSRQLSLTLKLSHDPTRSHSANSPGTQRDENIFAVHDCPRRSQSFEFHHRHYTTS